MPTFDDPAADAAEAQQALRGLAHATARIEDPTDIYLVLGSLSQGAASLGQVLHQIAGYHDRPQPGVVGSKARTRQAAAYQVSWELHRAAEILRQVAVSLDHAHEAEARITYRAPGLLREPQPSRQPAGWELGL